MKRGPRKHDKKLLQFIGFRHLAGEKLIDLSRLYKISYRVLRYHSQRGFYIDNYFELKDRSLDGVVFVRGKPIGVKERVVRTMDHSRAMAFVPV